MSSPLIDLFIRSLGETALMVSASSLATLVIGLPIAVLLVVTGPGGLVRAPLLNRFSGWVVNGFRSTPFIILLVALIPVTRLIVGTSIGTVAAIVPLSIAAIPFYARVAEVALREVDRGLVEAVQAMGGHRRDIVFKVLIPEALPGLVGGLTITIVALIGQSAMAGAVGGGGLGDLAIRYGYQRFDTTVMAAVIVILIALVSGVQLAGDRLAKRLNRRA
ncbi:MAG TPA: methionine ABC transporter permease [Hypericibacter adhaerens]|jgi:D-methionine transport system permease protein|uniref:Metal ABC transporter permease n=1 Tax=Hypericibacter adhaerens TaxID=2602016 RepID=A0A5J6MYV0_9PROT|nr:methionine ABC transporter permease [Hypericibacter adhaerens]QEX22962.1 metal ABC transporter permease [Hypericibacter adhaerens]HWA43545.1 methionine ABC transporter permease [Hypericibacter adhaerens]